jgi:hypothetical protein
MPYKVGSVHDSSFGCLDGVFIFSRVGIPRSSWVNSWILMFWVVFCWWLYWGREFSCRGGDWYKEFRLWVWHAQSVKKGSNWVLKKGRGSLVRCVRWR